MPLVFVGISVAAVALLTLVFAAKGKNAPTFVYRGFGVTLAPATDGLGVVTASWVSVENGVAATSSVDGPDAASTTVLAQKAIDYSIATLGATPP